MVHIGTHKTGTKSLQSMLAENPAWFAEQGLYYPTTGSLLGGGHHNIAWELIGDVRFDPHSGSLDELVHELQEREPLSVLLSSEDFESLYRRPESLARLRSALEELGYRVEVLVVLRAPVEYVPSLYWELRKSGLRQSFDDFVAGIIVNGGVMFRNWDLRVNYEPLVTGFAHVFGAGAVHAVRYEREDSVRAVLRATSALLGVPIVPIDRWTRRNVQLREDGWSSSEDADLVKGSGSTEVAAPMSDAQFKSIASTFRGLVDDLVQCYPVPEFRSEAATRAPSRP